MSELYLSCQQGRALGYCVTGMRRFCTRYELDFKLLVKGEMPAKDFADTGDALALRLVKYAEENK